MTEGSAPRCAKQFDADQEPIFEGTGPLVIGDIDSFHRWRGRSAAGPAHWRHFPTLITALRKLNRSRVTIISTRPSYSRYFDLPVLINS